MPRVGQAAAQREPVGPRDPPRQPHHPLARVRDARTPIAAVDFDPDREARLRLNGLEHRHRHQRVHGHAQFDPAGERGRLLDPGRVEREGPEDVVEAGVGEDAGLRQRGHRDPVRSGGALARGDLHALVRLHVRTKPDAECVGASLHAAHVVLEDVEVEDEGRRGEVEQIRYRPSRGAVAIIGGIVPGVHARKVVVEPRFR